MAAKGLSYKEVVIVGPEAQNTNREIQQNYLPNVLFQIRVLVAGCEDLHL